MLSVPHARPVAVLSCAVLLLASCGSDESSDPSGSAEGAGSKSPAAEESEELPPPNSEQGTPVEAGTYTYDRGPFPVTFTTEGTTYDMSRGGDPYRVIAMEDYGVLSLDFPVSVADLTEPPKEETDEFGVYEVAGPIDFPDDIDAWLEGAIELEVEGQGTLEVEGGTASWWDLAVDPEAGCFSDAPNEACVSLWPFLEAQEDRQIGAIVFDRGARLYAVEAGDEPVMLLAEQGPLPEEDVPEFLEQADKIVSTIEVG